MIIPFPLRRDSKVDLLLFPPLATWVPFFDDGKLTLMAARYQSGPGLLECLAYVEPLYRVASTFGLDLQTV